LAGGASLRAFCASVGAYGFNNDFGRNGQPSGAGSQRPDSREPQAPCCFRKVCTGWAKPEIREGRSDHFLKEDVHIRTGSFVKYFDALLATCLTLLLSVPVRQDDTGPRLAGGCADRSADAQDLKLTMPTPIKNNDGVFISGARPVCNPRRSKRPSEKGSHVEMVAIFMVCNLNQCFCHVWMRRG